MGYNTTVVLMNDALDYIGKDIAFGHNLADAIHEHAIHHKKVDVASIPHGNAATVLGSAHSSITNVYAVGGNYGSLIGQTPGYSHHKNEDQVAILKAVADQLGYTLRKK